MGPNHVTNFVKAECKNWKKLASLLITMTSRHTSNVSANNEQGNTSCNCSQTEKVDIYWKSAP